MAFHTTSTPGFGRCGAAPRRPILWLALGAAVGAALAGLGLWGEKIPANLPPGAVARVNDVPILREDYERAVTALQADRRGALQPGDRAHVLDRLIEEELLVQRGLELGFVRYDRRVRADLTRAVIDSVVSEVEDAAPSEAELHAFFEANRSFFVPAGRLRARQVFVRSRAPEDEAAAARARIATTRLRAGEAFERVAAELGDPSVSGLPDRLLSPSELERYLGPTVTRALGNLREGEVSEPIASRTGWHVIELRERVAESPPPLAAIRPRVLTEYRRRAGEDALRRYLDDLRQRAEVAVVPESP